MRHLRTMLWALAPALAGCGGAEAPVPSKPRPAAAQTPATPVNPAPAGGIARPSVPTPAGQPPAVMAAFARVPASRAEALAAFLAVQKNQGQLVYGDDGGRTVREFRLLLGGVNEAMLEALKWFPEVESLQLSSNVQEPWLRHLKPLTNLKSLSLGGAKIGDDALKNLTGLDKLESLRLDGTRVTDAGMVTLAEIPSLQTLVLIGTGVGDAGLDALKALPNPRTLSVRNTRVTEGGVRAFREAHPECKVVH